MKHTRMTTGKKSMLRGAKFCVDARFPVHAAFIQAGTAPSEIMETGSSDLSYVFCPRSLSSHGLGVLRASPSSYQASGSLLTCSLQHRHRVRQVVSSSFEEGHDGARRKGTTQHNMQCQRLSLADCCDHKSPCLFRSTLVFLFAEVVRAVFVHHAAN
eukprot:TRINITY_DN107663_c0_g1_i1.p1 TRINITY_DN107663_c0_g1~~TRINITY_DN107663_c0_g1_i1.p1  ORF type:complete len:157 (-),score=20.42 TRINITY_DN107663_c0_g1_i1:80-550(-)